MIYQSQKKRLNVLQVVSRGENCEIVVCEDLNDFLKTRYTVLVLDDHEIVKRFLTIYSKASYLPADSKAEYFSSEGRYLIVYPYVRPRPLADFYMGSTVKIEEAEEICKNLIAACMACGLPWPILHLVLKQRQINIAQDNSIHLSYAIDLSSLEEDIGEDACAVECARILLSILKIDSDKKSDSYLLLEMKIGRESYSRFMELYRDIDISSVLKRKWGILAEIRGWFIRNKDRLFRILLAISLILFLFTLISLISNAIFGEVPWLRIFIRSFEKIGLESLVR